MKILLLLKFLRDLRALRGELFAPFAFFAAKFRIRNLIYD